MAWKPCQSCGGVGCWYDGYTGKIYVPEDPSPPPPTGGGDHPIVGLLVLVFVGVIAYAIMTSRPSGPGSSRKEPVRSPVVAGREEVVKSSAGALEIEKAGDLYTYYDVEFMKQYGPNARGYTLSRTHPYEEVEFIEEQGTYYQRSLFAEGERVSWGRKIPRDQVRPVRYTPGNYIGDRPAARFYYLPPSTASDWELSKLN